MVDKLLGIGVWIIGGIVVIFIVIIFIGLGIDLKQALSKRYWIDTGGSSYYTDNYKKSGDCLEFTDWYGNKKICGFYTITDRGE